MPKRYTNRSPTRADGGLILSADQIATAPAAVRTWLRKQAPLAQDLKRAVERDELFIEYQPLVDGGDRRLRSMEALVRWRHPTGWIVPPAAFIPTAEITGLIVDIDRWVLRSVCQQIRAWQDSGLCVPRVAVNMSAVGIETEGLQAYVEAALAASDLVPGQLGIEITETALMSSIDRCDEILQQLRKIGITIAIDDFGIGHSCLAYLSRFRPDWLKIPVSFVSRVLTHDWDRVIVDTIMRLVRDIGVSVVAEGVETPEQNKHMLGLGCNVMQGFLFARPLRVEAAAEFLKLAASDASPPTNARDKSLAAALQLDRPPRETFLQ